MKSSQYQKIAGHPLRSIFRNMVTDARDLPTRSELRAAIDEAVPDADAKIKDALFTKAIELAQKAATEGRESWFDLRGAADRLVLTTVEGFEAADRLLGSGEDTTAEDVSGALAAMDDYDPTQRGLRAVTGAARQAELEANLRRQHG